MQGEKIVLNEMEQLRYDKLLRMQDEGRDPFKVEKFDQTHHSKQIKDNFENFEGKERYNVMPRKMSLEKSCTKHLKNLTLEI